MMRIFLHWPVNENNYKDFENYNRIEYLKQSLFEVNQDDEVLKIINNRVLWIFHIS